MEWLNESQAIQLTYVCFGVILTTAIERVGMTMSVCHVDCDIIAHASCCNSNGTPLVLHWRSCLPRTASSCWIYENYPWVWEWFTIANWHNDKWHTVKNSVQFSECTKWYCHTIILPPYLVPSISLMITSAGTSEAGQNYSLNCSVIGAETLKPNITYCWYNESSNPRIRLVTNKTLTLLHLQEYYTGNYTCEMSLTSPYLRENLIRREMKKVIVQSKLLWYSYWNSIHLHLLVRRSTQAL